MVAAGAYLREHRKRRGLSQSDIAAALGMSQPKVVTDWESGKRRPAADVWNLWIEMVGANPATAHDLVLDGAGAEEGAARARAEFTADTQKASKTERQSLVEKINARLTRLRAEVPPAPTPKR